jgi:hypothetical protein
MYSSPELGRAEESEYSTNFLEANCCTGKRGRWLMKSRTNILQDRVGIDWYRRGRESCHR